MNYEDYAGKTILFIVPHADDLHYQAGGTAALWASHGARVISIAITDSARGTRQLGEDLERMKIIGEQEARRAAGVTGLSEVIFLRYPDGFLHAVPYLKLREQFIGLIRRYRPQVVITWDPFNPREPNPDHRHAAPAIYDAACFADYPLFHPEQLREGISPWPVEEIWLLSNFPETLDQYVDITPVIEVKMQALLEYEKDMHLAVDDLRRPLEAADPNSPLIPKLQREHYREIMGAFVRERARDLGNRCGCQYAEGFRTIHLGFPYDFKGFRVSAFGEPKAETQVVRELDTGALKMELRVGIIGAGWISAAHAEGWRALGDRVRVVGVADVNEAAARRLADPFGAQVYTDYRLLIERGDLDAVDILIPPHLHVEIVRAAAGAGLHILCEKPLARDLEEAGAIGEALESSGVTYMPAHNTIFYPSIQRARAYCSSGDLGKVYFIRSLECYTDVPPERLGEGEPLAVDALKGEAWRASKELLKGGALIDGGYHAVYRLLYLADSEPVAVTALMGLYHPKLEWETEDTALLLVRFASGLIGEVMISYAFDGSLGGQDRILLIAGREGLLAGNEHSLYFRPAGWNAPAAQELSSVEGDAAMFASIAAEIDHFAGCLMNQQTPVQTFQDALRALQVVRAAYRSAERGETVRIET